MHIRFAEKNDKFNICKFIDEYWAKDHILVRWEELFDEYYENSAGGYNFAIAEEETSGDMYGICGFIYANHLNKPDIWLALWKVIPSSIPSLGLDLVRFIHRELDCNLLCCCGIRKEVVRLYQFLGYQTGTLKHYYRLADLEEYRIANVVIKKILPVEKKANLIIMPLPDEKSFKEHFSLASFSQIKPYKDENYIIHKYYHNIAYQYRLWGIVGDSNDICLGVIVGREIVYNERKILRIVDFLGDESALADCTAFLDNQLRENGYEYIDMYEYGLHDETMLKIGMIENSEEDENTIPNYFEPYECSKVKIHFFTSNTENFRMFKADGDQERPNMRED